MVPGPIGTKGPSGGGRGLFKPQGPPYLIRTVQVRREAISQIYNTVDGKDPPPHNITSEALRSTTLELIPRTLKTWACQILCMISEYHMACVTRGSRQPAQYYPG